MIEEALRHCQGQNFYPGFQQMVRRALLAAHELIGQPGPGLRAIERMLAAGGTPLWSAEAYRLRAELLLARGAPAASIAHALDHAERIAAQQGAEGHRRRIASTRARIGASL